MGLLHSLFAYYCSRVRYAIFPPNIDDIGHLIVQVEQGKLRGKESVSKYSRKKYCSFLGVPFAKPPVDELRFMPPQPCEQWMGLYDATYERDHCRQYDFSLLITFGGEDCLHTNIFTPKPPREIRDALPVMVWIHGGGYIAGGGSRKLYGADYLIGRDVIVVSLNYRLNCFGFLNVGIPECPGNAGLKDIIFCLQWIRRNIRNFGGNPDNITLFGESAGSSAINHLLISPLAQGLFSKTIMQSGCSRDPYISRKDPIEVAFLLGAKCGYFGTDRLKLVQHLRKLSCKELHRAYSELDKELIDDKPLKLSCFGPSIEQTAEGAVIPPNFQQLRITNPVPSIYGINTIEGIVLAIAKKNYSLGYLGSNCMKVLKDYFKLNPELYESAEKEVRKLYFGDKPFTNSTFREMMNLITDLFLYHMHDDVNSLIDTQAPIYLYRFNYFGRLNLVSLLMRVWYPRLSILNNFNDAAHGDELAYLFRFELAPIYPPVSEENMAMIDLMTTMWTNFAKTGNPSTANVQWEPATRSNMRHLLITENPQMVEGNIGSEEFVKLHQVLDPLIEEIL